MGLVITGRAEVSKPTRCNWCGLKTRNLVKVHSREDKSTLRICERHWLEMPRKPRNWDLWVAASFPKFNKKICHEDAESFLTEAKWFLKNERMATKMMEGK